jgi:hypothetical protein
MNGVYRGIKWLLFKTNLEHNMVEPVPKLG